MAGDRDQVEHAIAEVELRDLVGPRVDPEVLRDVGRRSADDRVELGIAADVIAVTVGVRDHQLQAAAGEQLVDDRAQVRVAGAGVQQESAFGPEQEVDERPFEVRSECLPDDRRAVVVPVDLVLRTGRRCAVVPP